MLNRIFKKTQANNCYGLERQKIDYIFHLLLGRRDEQYCQGLEVNQLSGVSSNFNKGFSEEAIALLMGGNSYV